MITMSEPDHSTQTRKKILIPDANLSAVLSPQWRDSFTVYSPLLIPTSNIQQQITKCNPLLLLTSLTPFRNIAKRDPKQEAILLRRTWPEAP